MFPKKALMIVGVIILIAGNIVLLAISSRRSDQSMGLGAVGITLAAPFQKIGTYSVRFVKDIWSHYFFLVSVAKENSRLQKSLGLEIEKNNRCNEVALSNVRLRNLLKFKKTLTQEVVAAEVVGKDPSSWFKTLVIDKGRNEGVHKGLPVVVPEGIVGLVTDASQHFAKVLLIIDQNSAVDAVVQETRARGLIKGQSPDQCLFNYVLRKHTIKVGDTVVSSGLDGVYPKGLRVGSVADVVRRNSGIFQEVTVKPFVDFEKLEEVLVILNPPKNDFMGRQ